MDVKRIPAEKIRIVDIINGRFFYGDKEKMKPSYVISLLGIKFSRVNVIGTVVDKFVSESENYSTITIEDGTGAIRAKAFKEKVSLLKEIEPGDLVMVIGKVKEFNGERYINCEIVRKVEDVNYEILRKLEILNRILELRKIVSHIFSISDEMSKEELKEYVKAKYEIDEEVLETILSQKDITVDFKPKVLKLIEDLDEGDGVEISKIFELSKLPENIIEATLDELINQGYIYEPKPGKIKKV